MSNDLKDILANSNKDIDNQQLMDYLSHQLPHAQQHEMEKNMADDPFVNDAVEGLQQIDSNKNLQAYVEQLNSDLQKQIGKSKKRKNKRRWKDNPQTYIAMIAILILLALSFILLKKYLDARRVNNAVSGTPINSEKGTGNKNNTVQL
jgi:ribosome-associated translation inhibitor RaiA